MMSGERESREKLLMGNIVEGSEGGGGFDSELSWGRKKKQLTS